MGGAWGWAQGCEDRSSASERATSDGGEEERREQERCLDCPPLNV